MFGAPATLEIVKPADRPGEASISLTLDDAVRAKQGFGSIPGVSGPIVAHITAPLDGAEKSKAQIELDLTRTAIECGLPGLTKPAGRPAKAMVSLSVGEDSTQLDPIVLDLGPMQARGSVELAADQSLISAKFSQVKLSPGDDMKVEASKSGETTKLTIRATTVDARPFLKSLTSASTEVIGVSGGAGGTASRKDQAFFKDVDIDLKSGLLTGHNKQVLSGVEMRLVKHGESIRQFGLTGRFGRDSISGSLSGAGSNAPQINISAQDGGSLLAFIDLYKHMEGGKLSAGIRVGDDSLGGNLEIKDFVLRDEPALRRLVSESVPPQGDNPSATAAKIDAGAVPFNRLQVRFQRAGNRVDLQDGVMYGATMGMTVEGWLDFVHDRVSMKGTFVPAYAVNNLFSKIPVFGIFLGGGSNEGLFAVNYRIGGAASAPVLNINPLSAIAPGFLRKIFGAGELSSPQPGQPDATAR
jgi:hypothetical protein